MMTKNSFKLVSANFYTFWKMLLYRLTICLICALLVMIVFPSISYAFSSSGFVSQLEYYLGNVSIFPNINVALSELLKLANTFIDGVLLLAEYDIFALCFSLSVAFILLPFLNKLGDIAFGECIYSYMSSLSKTSFVVAYIKKMATSAFYALLSSLFNLLILTVTFSGGYLILKLIKLNTFISYTVPVLFTGYLVLFVSLAQTLVCGWMPAIVVFNDGAIKGFRQGVKTVFRRFLRTFSNLLVINFIFALLVYVFNFYVLVVLIPLYALYILTFQMVMFFGSHGMRYYVDLDTILTPKKLETYDKMSKVKHLI